MTGPASRPCCGRSSGWSACLPGRARRPESEPSATSRPRPGSTSTSPSRRTWPSSAAPTGSRARTYATRSDGAPRAHRPHRDPGPARRPALGRHAAEAGRGDGLAAPSPSSWSSTSRRPVSIRSAGRSCGGSSPARRLRAPRVVVATTYVDEANRGSTVLLMDQGQAIATGSPSDIIAAVPGAVGVVRGPDRPPGPVVAMGHLLAGVGARRRPARRRGTGGAHVRRRGDDRRASESAGGVAVAAPGRSTSQPPSDSGTSRPSTASTSTSAPERSSGCSVPTGRARPR